MKTAIAEYLDREERIEPGCLLPHPRPGGEYALGPTRQGLGIGRFDLLINDDGQIGYTLVRLYIQWG